MAEVSRGAAGTGSGFEMLLTVAHLAEGLRWTLRLRGRWRAEPGERLSSEVRGEIALVDHEGSVRDVAGRLDVGLRSLGPAVVGVRRIVLDVGFAGRRLRVDAPVGWGPHLPGITLPGRLVDGDATREVEVGIDATQLVALSLILNLAPPQRPAPH